MLGLLRKPVGGYAASADFGHKKSPGCNQRKIRGGAERRPFAKQTENANGNYSAAPTDGYTVTAKEPVADPVCPLALLAETAQV